MYKVMIAIAAAFIVVLAGCASQPSGAGASSLAPAPTGNAPMPPIPEQPGYNRWGTAAPAG